MNNVEQNLVRHMDHDVAEKPRRTRAKRPTEIKNDPIFLFPIKENFVSKSIVRVEESRNWGGYPSTSLYDTGEIVDKSLHCKKYGGNCSCTDDVVCLPLEKYEYSFGDYLIIQYFFCDTGKLTIRDRGPRDIICSTTHPPDRWWAWGRIIFNGEDIHESQTSNARRDNNITGINVAIEWIKNTEQDYSRLKMVPRWKRAACPSTSIVSVSQTVIKDNNHSVAAISEMISKANTLIRLLYKYGGVVFAPRGVVQNTLMEIRNIQKEIKNHNDKYKRTDLFPGSNEEKTYNTLLVWSYVRDLLGDRFYTDKHLFLASSFASDVRCLLDMHVPVENIVGAEISIKEHNILLDNMDNGNVPAFLCINDDISKIYVRSPKEYCSVYCDFKGTLSPKNLETVRIIVEQMNESSVFAATFSLRAEGFHSPHDRAAEVSKVIKVASKYDYALIRILKYVGINGTPMETYIYHINPLSEREDPLVYDIHKDLQSGDD